VAKAPPDYKRYVNSDVAIQGFSKIALHFWKDAERLRDHAEQQTKDQTWRTHWSVLSAICLYHAALECFINEEITFHFTARLKTSDNRLLTEAFRIQGDTLNAKKIDGFWSLFGVADKVATDVKRRAVILANLRNCLYRHWPLFRDVRDYPTPVIAALDDAQIARVDTSWTAQCSDVRLAEWAANVVRGFVDEWWRLGQKPIEIERINWEYGPDWRYPSDAAASSSA
jgi:hypothetical protein